MDGNAALEMGDKKVSLMCWAHSRRKVLERICSTAVPAWFPQEPTLKKRSIYNNFQLLVEKPPQTFQTLLLLQFTVCTLWVHGRNTWINPGAQQTQSVQYQSYDQWKSSFHTLQHFILLRHWGSILFSTRIWHSRFLLEPFLHIGKTELHFILSLC